MRCSTKAIRQASIRVVYLSSFLFTDRTLSAAEIAVWAARKARNSCLCATDQSFHQSPTFEHLVKLERWRRSVSGAKGVCAHEQCCTAKRRGATKQYQRNRRRDNSPRISASLVSGRDTSALPPFSVVGGTAFHFGNNSNPATKGDCKTVNLVANPTLPATIRESPADHPADGNSSPLTRPVAFGSTFLGAKIYNRNARDHRIRRISEK